VGIDVLIERRKPAGVGKGRGPGYINLYHIGGRRMGAKCGNKFAVLIRGNRWELDVLDLDLSGMQPVELLDFVSLLAGLIDQRGKLNGNLALPRT
jgi:hypothetical protein